MVSGYATRKVALTWLGDLRVAGGYARMGGVAVITEAISDLETARPAATTHRALTGGWHCFRTGPSARQPAHGGGRDSGLHHLIASGQRQVLDWSFTWWYFMKLHRSNQFLLKFCPFLKCLLAVERWLSPSPPAFGAPGPRFPEVRSLSASFIVGKLLRPGIKSQDDDGFRAQREIRGLLCRKRHGYLQRLF